MSFVVVAALAIGLLIAVPIAAHLLRRGRAKEQEFPPAALVPITAPVARQRSRLEDRLLLALRGLIVLSLALLGATPLVKCSRLSLTRNRGASVALALVLDDSLSMRAAPGGGDSRWELGKSGARDLLRSAREGDAVTIVLAGRPARLALGATTDLALARKLLEDLEPSDRPTDLQGAISIARFALKPLPHVDKHVAVFSDFADRTQASAESPIWAPMPGLAAAVDDCGIASAELRGRRVSALVACTSASAARNRSLEVTVAEHAAKGPSNPDGGATAKDGVLVSAKLAARSGSQTVDMELPTALVSLDARLTGSDAMLHDDSAPVAPEASALTVAVIVDPSLASVSTGGPTIVEQALAALGSDAVFRPLSLVPDDSKELGTFAALVLDDPPGLTPEMRSALTLWVERGGVALALFGPRAAEAQLGSTLEPFARGKVRWEATSEKGLEVKSAAWLGSEAKSLADIAAKGRALIDDTELSGATVSARWQDNQPFLIERAQKRGLLLSAGLPASVAHSDFALRAGFLALLDHTLEQAERRSGPRRSIAGSPWTFPMTSAVEVSGPTGRLNPLELASGPLAGAASREQSFLPTLHGRYSVTVDADQTLRMVTLDAEELSLRPQPPNESRKTQTGRAAPTQVDASPELALLLLACVAAELIFRFVTRLQNSRRRKADGSKPSSPSSTDRKVGLTPSAHA